MQMPTPTTGTAEGELITANASANVKGAYSTLDGGATGFAYEAITLCIGPNNSDRDFLIDISRGSGGSEFVIVQDLHFAALKSTGDQCLQIYIPVHVPEGSTLSARCQSSGITSNTINLLVIGHASGLGGAPGFSRCVPLFTPASSRGINVDPGGSANTKGGWVEIEDSTSDRIGAMFGLVGHNGDIARAAVASMLIDIGVGSAGNESVLYPNASIHWGAVKDGPANCPRIPVFACDVPAASRIVAQAQCLHATDSDRDISLALYGLVP